MLIVQHQMTVVHWTTMVYVTIDAGPSGGSALLTALGITAGEYAAPTYLPAYSYEQPRWRTTDTDGGRPTGSVWQNLSTANKRSRYYLKIL